MLKILVNNTPLILDPKTTIKLEMNTSYFDVDEIKGDVVWHFDIPALGNEETLNYANFITVRNKFKYYSCIITLHCIPIGRGQMVISKTTNKTIRVAVSLNSFGVDFDEVSLKDAPYESERIGGNPHTEAAVLQHAKEVNSEVIERDYRFPMVYAPQFYGDDVTTDDVAGEHPEFNAEYLRYINHWDNGDFINNQTANGQSLVPFPLLVPVIQKLLEKKEYSLSGALINEDYLKNLLVFNNVSLDSFVSDYKIHAQGKRYNEGVLHFWIYPYYQKIPFDIVLQDDFDCYLDSVYLVRESGRYELIAQIKPHAPYATLDLKWRYPTSGKIAIFKGDDIIYERIYSYPRSTKEAAMIYMVAAFDLLLDDTLTVKILTTDEDGTGSILIDSCFIQIFKSVDNVGQNVNRNFIDIKDHIPSINMTKVLNGLRNAFFMAVFFDDENKMVETEFLKDVLANRNYVDVSSNVKYNSTETTPEDTKDMRLAWQHKEDLNDIKESNLLSNLKYFSELAVQYQKTYASLSASNAIYVYDKPFDTATYREWMFYRQNFQPYGNENAAYNPNIEMCPLPAQEVNNKIMPYTSQLAISDNVPDSDNDVGFQVLQWYGVLDVPYASPLSKRENNEVLGSLSIDFNGENGIVTNYGLDWLSFIASSEEFKVLLTDLDIWKFLEIQSLFLPKKKVNHPRWVLANNVKALPKQFTAEIDISGKITAAELVLVKKSE